MITWLVGHIKLCNGIYSFCDDKTLKNNVQINLITWIILFLQNQSIKGC